MNPIQNETHQRGRAFAAFVRQRTRIIALREVLLCVLIFANSRGIQEVEAASPQTQIVSPSESMDNEKAFLKELWPVLDYGKRVDRIYYRGSCLKDATRGVAFRQLVVRPAPVGECRLAATKYMLRDEKNISVEEDDTAAIRIRIGRVPDAILRAQIPRLTLSPLEQYNAWPAIWAIQNSPEVRSAMQDLHIRTPTRATNMIVVQPADGLPHLPGVITGSTVDQALDMIAKTFRGAIVYKTCAPPEQFDIDFENAGNIYSAN